MLVLSRKLGQSVYVGDTKINIVACARGGVRLGFDAPENVRVLRSELLGTEPGDETPVDRNDRQRNGESRTNDGPRATDRRAG